jgi:cell division protein FtsB
MRKFTGKAEERSAPILPTFGRESRHREGPKHVLDDGSWVAYRDPACTAARSKSASGNETPPQSTGFLNEGPGLKRFSQIARLARPEDGLRAVVDRAPQAGALAASWIERIRPLAVKIYALRRRIATVAVAGLAASLFLHVMFGANGMVVYKQKRAEYQQLEKQIVGVEHDNDRYNEQIQGLKTDQTSIEKEAREQLGYAKPGEYVYVPPAPPKPAPPPQNRSAKR